MQQQRTSQRPKQSAKGSGAPRGPVFRLFGKPRQAKVTQKQTAYAPYFGSPFLASDSGMTTAYRPAQHVKPGIAGLLGRLQNSWQRALGRVLPGKTTEQGSAGAASPSSVAYELFSLRYERRSVIAECRQMYDDDLRCKRSVNKFAREAVRGGVTITVADGSAVGGAVGGAGRGAGRGANSGSTDIPELSADAGAGSNAGGSASAASSRARRLLIAKEVARQIQTVVNPKLLSWAAMALVEGELFLQVILANKQIVGVKRMPASSMERLTDDADEFIDPEEAFEQLDVLTDQSVAKFPQVLMLHIRWEHVDGERYGKSALISVRRARRLLELSEESQVRRRIARAASARHWQIGDGKENIADWQQVEAFKAKNGFIEGEREGLDPMEVSRDYFSNSLVKATVLEGDQNVHNIDDLRYQQNVYAAGLPTPAPLYNLDAESVNRDVLDDLRAEWLKETQTLTDLFDNEIMRPLMNLGLLLQGILPETVNYSVHFSESTIESNNDIVDRVIRARQNVLAPGKNAVPDPLITRRQALALLASIFDVDDVDAELAQLEAEDELREAQQSPPQAAGPGEGDPDDDEDGEPERSGSAPPAPGAAKASRPPARGSSAAPPPGRTAASNSGARPARAAGPGKDKT